MAIPEDLRKHAGPVGVALVRAFDNGSTDPGWGLVASEPGGPRFMPQYQKYAFAERKILAGYNKGLHAFAIVMRSVNLLCIDIDGKNGGLDGVKRLGNLPPTLAETSKSGNGYHLFYELPDNWDDEKGFALIGDKVGIEQGVDLRGTGCVYHHTQQRWNGREIALLPSHLLTMLLKKEQNARNNNERIEKILATGDTTEVLMLQDEIMAEIKKPIAEGKRNTSLFALGNQLKESGYTDWDKVIAERAEQVGLSTAEADKLVKNIDTYGARSA